MKTSRLIDETGNRYGRLTVLGIGSRRRTTQMWICRCDCGQEHEANGSNLRSGDIRSCGNCGYFLLPGDEAAFRQALNNYKKNAKSRGVPFDLTTDEFRWITQQNCRYCGLEPANIHKPSRARAGAKSFTYNGIDRLDNSKGYFLQNCAPCCATCNGAKSKMSADEFLRWVARVAKHSAQEINLLYKG